MHPYLIEQLANDHRRELRRSAPLGRQAPKPERRAPARSARRRAGWVLIELGLRLAGTAGDA